MSRILKKISAQHGLEKLRNFLRKGRIGDGLDVWGDPLSNPLIKEPLCLLGLIAMGPDKVFSSCWLHGHRSVVTDEPRTTPMGSPSRKKKNWFQNISGSFVLLPDWIQTKRKRIISEYKI